MQHEHVGKGWKKIEDSDLPTERQCAETGWGDLTRFQENYCSQQVLRRGRLERGEKGGKRENKGEGARMGDCGDGGWNFSRVESAYYDRG